MTDTTQPKERRRSVYKIEYAHDLTRSDLVWQYNDTHLFAFEGRWVVAHVYGDYSSTFYHDVVRIPMSAIHRIVSTGIGGDGS